MQLEKLANFDENRILEIEEKQKHDVIAFLTNVAEYVGEDAKFIHKGLTSSDILDTQLFSSQLINALEIIIKEVSEILVLENKKL